MNWRCVFGLCAIALVTIPAFPSSSVAQGKSLKDQLVGTWIYVSSTGKREDGSAVPRPSAQGAVTYTADGHFHFITVRTEVPKYASGDPARPSPEEAMAVASGVVAYTGTYTLDESTKTAHLNIDTSSVPEFSRSAKSAPDHHIDHRRRTEAHEPAHACRCDAGVGVQAGEVTCFPFHRPPSR
jgi:hypothetical protein